jgi:tetratricopeptide (TPR) repeat protein
MRIPGKRTTYRPNLARTSFRKTGNLHKQGVLFATGKGLIMTRREQIEAMLKDDPEDEFLRYSLAMELEKEGDDEESLSRLQGLMQSSPPYVPAFHMAGQFLLKLGRHDEAKTALRAGIETAHAQGRQHDAGEMAELLATIVD